MNRRDDEEWMKLKLAELEVEVATEAVVARMELRDIDRALEAGRAVSAGEGFGTLEIYLAELRAKDETDRWAPPKAWFDED